MGSTTWMKRSARFWNVSRRHMAIAVRGLERRPGNRVLFMNPTSEHHWGLYEKYERAAHTLAPRRARSARTE